MTKLSRRQFLRSAGGITLLAMVPVGRGLFAVAETQDGSSPLLFTALPYIQPGAASQLVEGRESFVVAWQTEHRAADFKIEFGETKNYGRKAVIERTERLSGDGNVSRYNYAAVLKGLKLGKRYFYRVSCNGQVIIEGFSTTRRPRGQKIRFVSFGDNSCGSSKDHAIAYHAYNAHPDFVVNTGDNVYDGGTDSEYARYFFPVYNADSADSKKGAPLLRSVPFYTVMANHDVRNRDAQNRSVADMDKEPGSLAYYTNMHLPLNGPIPAAVTPVVGAEARQASFKNCAGARYPRMANYSFDYGDAHFLCLDSNIYIDPNDAGLQKWIEDDLRQTKALWKFVVYHHPAFNVGNGHYHEQHMRVLCPLFEKYNVDFVLNGHEHSYQRTQPMRFKPAGPGRSAVTHKLQRLVPGKFTTDTHFDGNTATKPDGIIHLTTGAGGNTLYNPAFTDKPETWLHAEDDNAVYLTRFVSDRHSFSVFDIDGRHLTLQQIDADGKVVDSIRVTK